MMKQGKSEPTFCNGCCYRHTCNHDLEKCCYLVQNNCILEFYTYADTEGV